MLVCAQTNVFFGEFSNQVPASPINTSKFVGGFWNVTCFGASLQTFPPNGQLALNMQLYVFDFANFQRYLAGFRASPISSCAAGAQNSPSSCQMGRIYPDSSVIFLVASYDVVSNSSQSHTDYLFEVLTAAYATGKPHFTCCSVKHGSALCCVVLCKGLFNNPGAQPL